MCAQFKKEKTTFRACSVIMHGLQVAHLSVAWRQQAESHVLHLVLMTREVAEHSIPVVSLLGAYKRHALWPSK